MHSRYVEELIEERVANLAVISKRRNDLLREMHQMIRRRRNIGPIFSYDEEDEMESDKFLLRFKMTEDDVETGSICHLDEQATSVVASPQFEAFNHPVHGTTSPILQEPASILSLPGHTRPSPISVETEDVVMADSPPAPSLLLEADDGDDELDLLKKSPPPPVEPNRRPLRDHFTTASLEPQLNASDMMVEKVSHISPTDSETERKPEITTLIGSTSLQPASHHVFRISTTDTRGDVPSEQVEETLSSEAIVAAQPPAAHSLTMPSVTHTTFFPEITVPTRKAIVVVTSQPSPAAEPDYTFPEASPPQPIPPTPKDPPQRLHQFQSDFTLPSLKSINPDYKKIKSLKRRREKEREAGLKEGRKDDWAPMGLNKWAATVNANPVWKKVARASKCLTTREWAIAMTELRLIRAIDRIDLLKREGRWSFRQPKKQRAIGGVLKTHWDYLMDEMKWMRVDFREERKWKLALAYNISTDVLDWHAAGTTEARVAKGICVRWKRRRPEEPEDEMAMDNDVNLEHSADRTDMEVDPGETQPNEGMSLLGVDYGSEDEDEDEDEDNGEDADLESRNVVDALEPSSLIASALDHADAKNEPRLINIQDVQPKIEEVEDLLALIKPDPASDVGTMIADDIKPDTTSGLKSTSNDPVLASQPTPSSNAGDIDTSSGSLKPGKSNIYAPYREVIAYSEDNKLFLDLEEFGVTECDTFLRTLKEAVPPPRLESIFPDLHILDFDLTPAVQTIENKKRPERKNDRDDPNKRPDDTLYTRLYPTGNFMTYKPTLVGPLRPSRNWKGGQWLSLDDSTVVPESDIPVKNDDSGSDLFDGRSSNGPSLITLQFQTGFMKDKEPRKRNDHLWNNTDDSLLKSLCDRYPNNWALISECFNGSRLTVPTDKRTPRDCLERWREKWGPEGRRVLETPSVVETTPPSTSTPMTTRGVKRLASVSISSVSPNGIPAGSEPRKKRRHALVLETIRKAGKKRAEALQKAQSQRKTAGVHETHAQYSKLPKRTPAELSRVKAEKEALALQELQARKRQEEIARNTALNRLPNGQGPPAVAQQAPQPQLQPQTTPAIQRPPVTGMPTQVVPQIRNQVNISHQQRTSTPAMQTGRLTQQQLLQAQARAAQQQQQQLAHAQNQIQTNVAVNGNVSGTNPHLSPPSYVNRDVALSVSPPHNSAVTSAVNSPRPPSAQAQAHPLSLQVPGNTGSRGTYYLPNLSSVQGYTTEQLQTALRLTQQQAQQGFANQS